jgi:hypothetical protein
MLGFLFHPDRLDSSKITDPSVALLHIYVLQNGPVKFSLTLKNHPMEFSARDCVGGFFILFSMYAI